MLSALLAVVLHNSRGVNDGIGAGAIRDDAGDDARLVEVRHEIHHHRRVSSLNDYE